MEGVAMFLIILLLYMAPSFVAGLRHHKNTNAITVLNLLTGWTLIGWVAALVWASTNNVHEQERHELKKSDA